jgi:hypothetical protein
LDIANRSDTGGCVVLIDLAPLLPDTAYRLINADLSPAH